MFIKKYPITLTHRSFKIPKDGCQTVLENCE